MERGAAGRVLYRIAGGVFTIVGAAGIFVPLLPGAVFLILAAACFARSSPRLEAWLVSHPRFGAGVKLWRERGAIPRGAKIAALSSMALSAALVGMFAVPLAVKLASLGAMALAAAFVASRPGK